MSGAYNKQKERDLFVALFCVVQLLSSNIKNKWGNLDYELFPVQYQINNAQPQIQLLKIVRKIFSDEK